MTLLRTTRKSLHNRKGQSVLEYVLMIAIVMTFAGGMFKLIKNGVDQGVLGLGGNLEKSLKTGRISVTIWKN
jgi:hypothetical protein